MPSATLPMPPVQEFDQAKPPDLKRTQGYFLALISRKIPVKWNLITLGALLFLVLLWAGAVHATWAHWGNLTIDSGHEMYVPAELAQGKLLYRDVWFMYGPLAPYFNSLLFRLFGMQLNVLYWAGSLSALGSALLLFLTGMQLSSWLAGWTAGAVVLMEAFQPSLFCFPLPYSFTTVYACLCACLFLWLVVRASASTSRLWILGAGTVAAAELLLKLEFGTACYLTLMLLIAVRGLQQRSWKGALKDAALILPGVAACGLVIGWMVSIAGIDFITQENILSWPTSYFMKKYGKLWLANTGFSITGPALMGALQHALIFGGILQGVHLVANAKRYANRQIYLRGILFLVALASLGRYQTWNAQLASVFFPSDMVAYVMVAALASWWYFWRQPGAERSPAVPLLLTFSALLAFRIMLKMAPTGYPIYYNGPVVVCFMLLGGAFVSRTSRFRGRAWLPDLLVCLGCLVAVMSYTNPLLADSKGLEPLSTERGTALVSKTMARNYRLAIRFMQEKTARGESVLSIPEDTSLYFLSGTHAPTRYYMFVPGLLSPGKMTDEFLEELERKRVRYLLWSNRVFPEYGAPVFGVDFDKPLGEYFRSHYRSVGPLVPINRSMGRWNAEVWERIPEGEHR
jgi:hypothetical protein